MPKIRARQLVFEGTYDYQWSQVANRQQMFNAPLEAFAVGGMEEADARTKRASDRCGTRNKINVEEDT